MKEIKRKPKKKMSSSIKDKVIALRLPPNMMEIIEDLAKEGGFDKTSVIKTALREYLDTLERESDSEALKDYVEGLINEEEYLNITQFDKVPPDVKDARKEYLKNLTKKIGVKK